VCPSPRLWRSMVDDVDPKVMAQIREHVSVLAKLDYPKVWVGEVGITADELLALQEFNDEVPDWLRVEPGEFVGIEGTDAGIQMPEASVDWIEGPTALQFIPDHFAEGELGNLQDEVGVIRAAKLNAVMVLRAFTISFAVGDEVDELSVDDRISIRTAWFEHDGQPAAMFYTGSTYLMVPLDELTTTDVDDDLLEELELYASGEPWGPYVVEDTLRARALVASRLQD
jgi:hypothetical protein